MGAPYTHVLLSHCRGGHVRLAESRLQAQAEQEREDLKEVRESDLSKLREECERKKQDEEKKLR